MADNAQKVSLTRSIDAHARDVVLQHIQNASAGEIPATLISLDKTNTIAVVQPEVQGAYNLPQLTVAIEGDEYTRRPWKKGDKGTLSGHSVSNGNMTGLRAATSKSSFTRPGNLSSMIWKPVGNTNFSPTDDQKSHVSYAPNGTIARDDQKKSQVKTHPTNGASVSAGGDGSGANGPHSVTANASSGVAVASSVAHTIAAPNATLDSPGNLTAQKNITSTSGNIAAPSGQVSGMSASFLSGILGGLQMLSGILSGGGSSGAPAVSINTNTGSVAVAAYIQTQPLTFATLPAAALALVGARACITDCTTSAFFAVAAGGGTLCVPVFCQQVAGATPTYRWVVGG